MKNILKKAYTLAEVVIVMLVIAVVVSISIKITKAKLDNITSYTYYSAYNTIKSVSSEMLRDFDAEEDDYGVTNNNIVLKIKDFFISNFGGLPVFSITAKPDMEPGTSPNKPVTEMYCINTNISAEIDATPIWKSPQCGYYCTSEGYMRQKNPPLPACPDGYYRTGVDDTPACKCVPQPDPEEPDIPDPPEPEPVPVPEPEPTPTCPDPELIPCGQECNASTGFVVRDIAGFSRTCNIDEIWNETKCRCIPTPKTVARNGEGFCRLFVSYSNTSRLAENDECSGQAIADDETKFADKDPDIILRNGMYLYNVSQDPKKIDILDGNSKNIKYTDASGTEIDIDEWGYTLYIDIDGVRGGEGRLWEDVFPFYVTLSGTVIPAYDMDNAGLSGGDSKLHLQTSVYDEFTDGSGRHTQWITKSKTFKESACAMGYVNPATRYCSTAPAVAGNPSCTQEDHDCRLKTIMPVKFFGR